MRPIETLLFALAAAAATGAASPAFADTHDGRRDRRSAPEARESRYARVERIWYEIEHKRAAIEREHARDLAEAERKHARERVGKGESAWLELLRTRGRLDARRNDELLALERERYARADEFEEDD